MGEQSRVARPDPGRRLRDRYRLERPLGRGAMAEVWEAVDEVLDRRVAVKVLFPHLAEDPAFLARFRREALAVARISHPGIVAVYDTVVDGGIDAIVLELVDGPTLRERLQADGVLEEDEVVRLGAALADALDAAHRVGVVHRDIKPSNILLAADGSPKLADFGVAADGAEGAEGLTAVGTLVGTAAYASPEQVGGAPADARSDVYGLACVLFEAAAGRPPFREATDAATALARLRHDAPDVRSVRPALSAGFARTLAAALAREPEVRTTDAAALARALSELERGGPTTHREDATVIAPAPGLGATTQADPPTVVLPPATAEVPVVSSGPGPARPDRTARRRPTAPAKPAEPTRPVPVGHRGRRAWMVVVGLFTLGSLLLVAALLQPHDAPSPTTTTEVPAGPLDVADVVTVDPFGTGTPGENDRQKDRVIDGDPATVWRTEGYENQTFGTKSGVGIALHLRTRARIDAVELDTTSEGWTAQVTVLDGLDEIPPEPPGRSVDLVAGRRRVPLDGAEGRYVLVWITRLGDGPGRHVVEIGELQAIGTPGG